MTSSAFRSPIRRRTLFIQRWVNRISWSPTQHRGAVSAASSSSSSSPSLPSAHGAVTSSSDNKWLSADRRHTSCNRRQQLRKNERNGGRRGPCRTDGGSEKHRKRGPQKENRNNPASRAANADETTRCHNLLMSGCGQRRSSVRHRTVAARTVRTEGDASRTT